jgi:HPt (histidine-containing phosphotransfer) domain-containing protein
MARLAHSLAGAAGTFGFDALTAAARRLDACLRDPASPRALVAAGLAEVSSATTSIVGDGAID